MAENTASPSRAPAEAFPAGWLEDWQQQQTGVLAPQTLQRYRGALQHFLTWYQQAEGRSLSRADLNPITLVGYRHALQETAATSTVNTHLSALRTWCAWLSEQGAIAVNPAARLKLMGRTEPTAPRALTPAQVNALLRQAQHTRYPARNTALLQVLVQTGMRISECCALRYQDVDCGEKRGQVRIRTAKGNQARSVPLNDSARQALADYAAPVLRVEPTLRAVAGVWPRPPAESAAAPLWTSERRNPLSLREMSHLIQVLVRDCAARNLAPPESTPHSLRHTFATRYLVRHPGDLVGLARLLGHRSLEATRIYVQPTEEALALRLEQIDLNAYGR